MSSDKKIKNQTSSHESRIKAMFAQLIKIFEQNKIRIYLSEIKNKNNNLLKLAIQIKSSRKGVFIISITKKNKIIFLRSTEILFLIFANLI